jgi:hypothetical protein
MKAKGQCLCGKVKVVVNELNNQVGACHCSMCRKWSGGPLFAVDCGSKVEFEGEENIKIFNSSDWAERGFCKECGSNLFYKLKQPLQYMILPGILDGIDDYSFDHQVFIEEKPSWYEFSNKTHNMTGKELFDKYS